MLEIDRRSWHYRWAMAGSVTAPLDLCDYLRRMLRTAFWHLIASMVIGALLSVIGLVLLILVRFLVEIGLVGLLLAFGMVLGLGALVGLVIGSFLAARWGVKAGAKAARAPTTWALLQAHRQAQRLGLCPLLGYK